MLFILFKLFIVEKVRGIWLSIVVFHFLGLPVLLNLFQFANQLQLSCIHRCIRVCRIIIDCRYLMYICLWIFFLAFVRYNHFHVNFVQLATQIIGWEWLVNVDNWHEWLCKHFLGVSWVNTLPFDISLAFPELPVPPPLGQPLLNRLLLLQLVSLKHNFCLFDVYFLFGYYCFILSKLGVIKNFLMLCRLQFLSSLLFPLFMFEHPFGPELVLRHVFFNLFHFLLFRNELLFFNDVWRVGFLH